tara:strand:+ start:5619 stop:5903 length:285 start_codon:yes stop_codon:yes gene_type:complete
MTLIKSVKMPFKSLMKFQKTEVVNEMVSYIMSHQPLTWSDKFKRVNIAMNDHGDKPATFPSEIAPLVKNALETFNRAPDGFELIDFMPSLSEAA